MKWKIGILAVIVGALAIYNLPYFEEMRAFGKVEDAHDIEMCDWYISEYPDGRHLDDVLFIKIKLLEDDMPTIVEYLQKFPSGNHFTEVNELCDKLWDAEITKYEERDKSYEAESAVLYMKEMLRYMKSHRVNSIVVDIHPTLYLKDFEEYDKDVRDIMELLNDEPLSLEKGMISLKSNFTATDNSTLMEILTEGVQKSMDKMFTPGFISVIAQENDMSQEMPNLKFEYTITSQEEKLGKTLIPHIWEYTRNGKTLNYLVGISISFKAHFTIPNSNTTYDYNDKGEPANNIKNVENIQDGYRRMTAMCFAEFSNKMSQNMGLDETYFQGDEENE